MSLNVGIGHLALFLAEADLEADEIEDFRSTYSELDIFLKSRGFSGHVEPEQLPELISHSTVDSFPAS